MRYENRMTFKRQVLFYGHHQVMQLHMHLACHHKLVITKKVKKKKKNLTFEINLTTPK